MNYIDAINYIKNTEKFGSNYGLEKTEKILELLGNPHKNLKCIHIAGTNGKGSTTAMINSILVDSGYKVGMYTSPYIEEFEERIQINCNNISKSSLSNIISEVKEAVDRVVLGGYEHPTEFEIITCVAFLYFFYEKVDFAVIEVGLGGRLDSTNVITPILCVITSISYDHMKILGDNLLKIANEKAGIIKNNVPVVLYPQKHEVDNLIERICVENNSDLFRVSDVDVKLLSINQEEGFQHIHLITKNDQYDIKLSLLGKHQIINCATSVMAIETLISKGININKKNIIDGLRKVKWIGRMEIMQTKPLIVIDGAHNIDGITNLKQSIEMYFKYSRLILILGILTDKQVDNMVKTIVPMACKVIAVTPHSYRGEAANELKKVILKYNSNCEAYEDYSTALNKAISYCNSDDMLLISGSLYMIGDMRKIIKAQSR